MKNSANLQYFSLRNQRGLYGLSANIGIELPSAETTTVLKTCDIDFWHFGKDGVKYLFLLRETRDTQLTYYRDHTFAVSM